MSMGDRIHGSEAHLLPLVYTLYYTIYDTIRYDERRTVNDERMKRVSGYGTTEHEICFACLSVAMNSQI